MRMGEVEGNERMDQYICKILLYRGKPPRKILLLMLQTHLLFVTTASVCLFFSQVKFCVFDQCRRCVCACVRVSCIKTLTYPEKLRCVQVTEGRERTRLQQYSSTH